MLESIYNYAKEILFFLLFMNLCIQLPGATEYKRYVRFVFGIVLILLCLTPVVRMFGEEEQLSYYLRKNLLQSELVHSDTDLFLTEGDRKDVIVEAYKEELCEQLVRLLQEETLHLLQAEFVLSENEQEYGKIEEIFVVAQYSNGGDKITIEPVQIGENSKSREKAEFLSPMEIHIKNKLAVFYNVEESNINVIVREKGKAG